MNFNKIASNLYISDNPQFLNYNHEIVHRLLSSIDVNFSDCLNTQPFSSNTCYIDYQENCPQCCQEADLHYIFLTATENYWSQWVYQFSHEYCHHLINGAFTGDISGLIWFEETICELSSMYNLHEIHSQWDQSENQIMLKYAPAFQNYLECLLSKNSQLSHLSNRPRWLRSWNEILSKPMYHRDYYNVIAAKMFPLFLENPNLWKIILHFGDMRKWPSMECLFDHLRTEVDDSYSASLQQLHTLLFS